MRVSSNQLLLLATVVLPVCKQLVESVTESREFFAITHKTSLKVAKSGVQNWKLIAKLELKN